MALYKGYSIDKDPKKAVKEIQSSFGVINPVLVVFFASPVYAPDVISESMKNAFPAATIIGCSSAGELVSGMMLKSSIVVMAFEADLIRSVHAGVIKSGFGSIDELLNSLSSRYNVTPVKLDPGKYVGLVLFDGLSGTEERSMERIGDMTNISVIGGSAGDDLAFSKTFVYLDGKSYTGASLLALIEPAVRFDLIKTQSFKLYGKRLTPTKVDPDSRKVIEFNKIPAVSAYAEALGISPSDLSDQFMKHPLGLMDGDEPYVRSPQRIEGDAVIFYCQVLEDVELEILTSTDIIADTSKVISVSHKKVPITAIINFNCILRTLQLEAEGKTKEYGEIFSVIPTIGFSTYGEEYIGHINQTATMLVFH
jgi:hypothetical protein